MCEWIVTIGADPVKQCWVETQWREAASQWSCARRSSFPGLKLCRPRHRPVSGAVESCASDKERRSRYAEERQMFAPRTPLDSTSSVLLLKNCCLQFESYLIVLAPNVVNCRNMMSFHKRRTEFKQRKTRSERSAPALVGYKLLFRVGKETSARICSEGNAT